MNEAKELYEKIVQLKMTAPGGKKRLTDRTINKVGYNLPPPYAKDQSMPGYEYEVIRAAVARGTRDFRGNLNFIFVIVETGFREITDGCIL